MRLLPNPFRGLLGRLLLALGLVGLLPLGWAVASLVNVNREAMFTQVLRTHALAARAGAERVTSWVDSRQLLLNGLAGHPALAAPLSETGQQQLATSLGAWSELGVFALVVLDPQGQEVVRVQLRDRAAAVDRSLATPPVDELPTELLTVGVDPETRHQVLRLSRELPGSAGSVVMLVDAEPLVGLLRPEEIGDEAELLLLDRQGRIVTDPRGATSDVRVPREMLGAALAGRVGGAGRYGAAPDQQVGAFSPVAGSAWVVVSLQPSAVAEGASREMARRSRWAVGVALVLIGAIALVASRVLIKPLRAVAAAQRRLARPAGAAAAVSGGDEVAELGASLAALERSLQDRAAVGKVFLGRYQVLDVLGSGAMGTVFRGYDPRLERPVALKTLRLAARHPDGVDRATLHAQLLHEAVTVARFSHPNIVGIYDIEDQGGAAFLAMELVDGPSLEHLVWQKQRLPASQVVPLAAAVARALAAAHQHGIVHRDVKPANILLGRDRSIKVSDFGIAELVAAAAQGRDKIFGTPGYLAPEALEGEGFTARSDLFALGATLHFCLLGSGPFHARTTREVVRRTLRGDSLTLKSRLPNLPDEVDQLVASLLRRDPSHRPASALWVAEYCEALAAAKGWLWDCDLARPVDSPLVAFDPAELVVHPPTLEPLAPAAPAAGAQWLSTRQLPRPTQPRPTAEHDPNAAATRIGADGVRSSADPAAQSGGVGPA